MFTVFYNTNPYNPYKSYPQNANRYVLSKTFKDEREARIFANTVENARIYHNGKKI